MITRGTRRHFYLPKMKEEAYYYLIPYSLYAMLFNELPIHHKTLIHYVFEWETCCFNLMTHLLTCGKGHQNFVSFPGLLDTNDAYKHVLALWSCLISIGISWFFQWVYSIGLSAWCMYISGHISHAVQHPYFRIGCCMCCTTTSTSTILNSGKLLVCLLHTWSRRAESDVSYLVDVSMSLLVVQISLSNGWMLYIKRSFMSVV